MTRDTIVYDKRFLHIFLGVFLLSPCPNPGVWKAVAQDSGRWFRKGSSLAATPVLPVQKKGPSPLRMVGDSREKGSESFSVKVFKKIFLNLVHFYNTHMGESSTPPG